MKYLYALLTLNVLLFTFVEGNYDDIFNYLEITIL